MLFLHLPVVKRDFPFPPLKKKHLKIVELRIKGCVSAAAFSAEAH